MTITVKVTAEDIANGRRKCQAGCMVALAMDRTFSEHSWKVAPCDFDRTQWRAENEDGGRVVIPQRVVDRICAWDCGANVEPFEFEVEV